MPTRFPVDPARFVHLVASAFPELGADLADVDGLETVQTRIFCDHTQAAIDRGDIGVVVTCFDIADRVIVDGDDPMKNAIHVSFLEDLDFRGSHGSEAFRKLTPALREGWSDINAYMDTLLDGEWTWKGPQN
jgi:hypothetical protein